MRDTKQVGSSSDSLTRV